MATHAYRSPIVEEHHIHHEADSDGSSSAVMAVLLVFAVAIVGFLLFVMQAFPFNAVQENPTTEIDVTLPAGTPDTSPGSNVAPDGVDF